MNNRADLRADPGADQPAIVMEELVIATRDLLYEQLGILGRNVPGISTGSRAGACPSRTMEDRRSVMCVTMISCC